MTFPKPRPQPQISSQIISDVDGYQKHLVEIAKGH